MPHFSTYRVKNKPEDETVVFVNPAAVNRHGRIVVTDKAWYFRSGTLFEKHRGSVRFVGWWLRYWPDLAKMTRYSWDEVSHVELETPPWLIPFGTAGVRVCFKEWGSIVFGEPWSYRKWLWARDKLGWPIVFKNRIYDRPPILQIRIVIVLLAWLAGIIALLIMAFPWAQRAFSALQ